MVERVRQSVIEALGGDDSYIVPYMCMAGEDFAEFTHRVPSAFYLLVQEIKIREQTILTIIQNLI